MINRQQPRDRGRCSEGVIGMPRRLLRVDNCQRKECFQYFKLEQLPLHIVGGGLIANALQDFAEDHIGETETLAIELRMDPICLGIPDALEIIDPDRGVDNHHASYFATRPRREASRSPFQVTLPRKRRMLRCPRVRMSRRSPSSTTARLVRAPLLRMA